MIRPPFIEVALYVNGYDLLPLDITNLLGVSPTRSGQKGEKRRFGEKGEIYTKAGFWVLSSGPSHNDLGKDLDGLLSDLKEKLKLVHRVPGVETFFIDIFIASLLDEDSAATRSFVLDGRLIKLIADTEFPVKVTFSVGKD